MYKLRNNFPHNQSSKTFGRYHQNSMSHSTLISNEVSKTAYWEWAACEMDELTQFRLIMWNLKCLYIQILWDGC